MVTTILDEELIKLINELVKSELALHVYFQLMIDGGNTVLGISNNLKEKGFKASKTRVYEEISNLAKLRLIKRISNRPPVYITLQTRENLENISMKFFRDTRDELMKKWAVVYPFLPDDMKTAKTNSKPLGSSSLMTFNPYPVVDIYSTDKEGLKRYFLDIFESSHIYVSNTILDTCFETSYFKFLFQREELEALFKKIRLLNNQYERVTIKLLTTAFLEDLAKIKTTQYSDPFYNLFFKSMNFEVRETKANLSSFILSDKNMFYPIGTGGITKRSFVMVKIRDSEITENAKFSFEKAWQQGKVVLKVENGEIT